MRYTFKKQPIVMAAIVILLCLTCLMGATLALFTSDPNDGTIGIITTSGDVSIDIVDTAGVTLQNKALGFIVTVDNEQHLVQDTDVWFEPGATFYTQSFQVKNLGDIPVNFSLSVSKDESIDIEEFNKAFELWVVKEGDDISTAEKITSFKVNNLLPGDTSDPYFLVIKMKETAGNEFQKKTYSGIGVTVYAVQGNKVLGKE